VLSISDKLTPLNEQGRLELQSCTASGSLSADLLTTTAHHPQCSSLLTEVEAMITFLVFIECTTANTQILKDFLHYDSHSERDYFFLTLSCFLLAILAQLNSFTNLDLIQLLTNPGPQTS
jgi:hypothetical protein